MEFVKGLLLKLKSIFCCCLNKEENVNNLKNLNNHKIAYACYDKPYGVMSFELSVQMRLLIESTKDLKERDYLKLLEDFVKLLDYLCHKNSDKFLAKYVSTLQRIKENEEQAQLAHLIKITLNVFKFAFKKYDDPLNEQEIGFDLEFLRDGIVKFGTTNASSMFIRNYLLILVKLPRLAFVRRGIKLKGNYFDSLETSLK